MVSALRPQAPQQDVPHCGPALLHYRTTAIDDFPSRHYHIAKIKRGGKPDVKDKNWNKC